MRESRPGAPPGGRLAAALGLLAACSSGDRQAPTPDDFVIEKLPANSGDKMAPAIDVTDGEGEHLERAERPV